MIVLASELHNNQLPGLKVRIYYNFNEKCWSVQHRGIVVKHASSVLLKDVSFLVLPGGYKRFLHDRVKNVHAYVCGTLVGINEVKPVYFKTEVT